MTRSALLGATGFVGSTLARQAEFSEYFSSKTIGELSGHYETIYCAAAPGKKWLANKEPDWDWESIQRLLEAIGRVSANRVILISTVDVFATPVGVDETSAPSSEGLNPYGLHRLRLEEAIQARFASSLVVRLPGLVGPGLRKNAVFDLHQRNNPKQIDSRSVFQFYPMVNLWWDIDVALQANLNILHLAVEPTSMAEIASQGLGFRFKNHIAPQPAFYDLQTVHAGLYGAEGYYQYDKRDVFSAVRFFAQSTPVHREDRVK